MNGKESVNGANNNNIRDPLANESDSSKANNDCGHSVKPQTIENKERILSVSFCSGILCLIFFFRFSRKLRPGVTFVNKLRVALLFWVFPVVAIVLK